MPELQISWNNACTSPLLLFAACLFHPHSTPPALNVSVPLVNAGVGTGLFRKCGGGRAETTERRWSLKVRFERDAAEQAVALRYTAGSVATDGSPAFSAFHRSRRPHPQMSAFSASLSVFVSFYFQPYCPSLSLVKNVSRSSAWHRFSIRYEASSWNAKLGPVLRYNSSVTVPLCHVSTCMHVSVHGCI